MELENLFEFNNKEEWNVWLSTHAQTETVCWVIIKKSDNGTYNISYLDAVEEALCYGWIDSTKRKLNEQQVAQRFSPRRKKSNWTELNKERARRLIRLNKMQPTGFACLPDLEEIFIIRDDILDILKADEELYQNFLALPPLYVRVRLDNIQGAKVDPTAVERRLHLFIEKTKENKLYGQWNDQGRL